MADIRIDTVYTLKLAEREYNILYDSLCYTMNSISSVQELNEEYYTLREQMSEVV